MLARGIDVQPASRPTSVSTTRHWYVAVAPTAASAAGETNACRLAAAAAAAQHELLRQHLRA